MKRKVRQYTKEFKQEAVHLAIKSGSVINTATSLGVPVATLHTWMHDLKKKGTLSKVNAESGKDMSALVDENRRLHKALAIALEEKEILKKAAAYFAQHLK
jgi:transposase